VLGYLSKVKLDNPFFCFNVLGVAEAIGQVGAAAFSDTIEIIDVGEGDRGSTPSLRLEVIRTNMNIFEQT